MNELDFDRIFKNQKNIYVKTLNETLSEQHNMNIIINNFLNYDILNKQNKQNKNEMNSTIITLKEDLSWDTRYREDLERIIERQKYLYYMGNRRFKNSRSMLFKSLKSLNNINLEYSLENYDLIRILCQTNVDELILTINNLKKIIIGEGFTYDQFNINNKQWLIQLIIKHYLHLSIFIVALENLENIYNLNTYGQFLLK